MANFGIGMGAFMQGLAGGARTGAMLQQNKLAQEDAALVRADRQADRAAGTAAFDAATASQSNAVNAELQNGATPEAAQQKAGSVYDHYMTKGIPERVNAYLKQGQPEKAKQFQDWASQEKTKKGMQSWAGALQASIQGDWDGMGKHLQDAYNNKEYMGDPTTLTGTKPQKDSDGNITGMELTFKNGEGKERTQVIKGQSDIFQQMLMAQDPSKVFEYGMAQLKSARETTAALAKEDRAFTRDLTKIDRKSILDTERDDRKHSQAIERDDRKGDQAMERDTNKEWIKAAAKNLADKPEKQASVRKELSAIEKTMAETDMKFDKLSDDEKLAKVMTAWRSKNEAAGTILSEGSKGPAKSIMPPMKFE